MGKKTVKRGRRKNIKISDDAHKKRIPKGIRVLIYYTIILAIFYLIMLFSSDISLFFGMVIGGALAKAFNIIVFLLVLYVIYGMIRRKRMTYYIALALYFFSILSSFITLLSWSGIKGTELGMLTGFVVPIIIVTLLINGLTFWYIITRRDYFFRESYSEMTGLNDRIFTYSIYSFLVIFFIVIIGSFINFSMRITDTIDVLMKNINDQTLTESLFYCEDAGVDRDICFVSVVTKHSDESYISNICQRIDSSFYRFTCYQAVE